LQLICVQLRPALPFQFLFALVYNNLLRGFLLLYRLQSESLVAYTNLVHKG
jgi:hypothetical protein